jgi:hypothetical protein
MQQRATVSSQSVKQVEDVPTDKGLSQPVELTDAELLQVGGGLSPNDNWATASPNDNW